MTAEKTKTSHSSDTPVLSVWTKGLPVTLGDGNQARQFGEYIRNDDCPDSIIVEVSVNGKKRLETWSLHDTFAEN